MINVVLKLITGEEIIGRLNAESVEDIENMETFNIKSPMWVLEDETGSMKLRSATMLAEEKHLIFYNSDIITYYIPSKVLVDYYNSAVEFNTTYTQQEIDKQIKMATKELDRAINEYSSQESNIAGLLFNQFKITIH